MATLHPTGNFQAEITDHGYGTSDNAKRSEFFWVKFKTDFGIISGKFYLTQAAIEHTIKKVRAMGFTGNQMEALADGTALVGNRCEIEVTHKPYTSKTGENKFFPEVGFVNPIGGGGRGFKRSDGAAANARRFDKLLAREPIIGQPAHDDGPPLRDEDYPDADQNAEEACPL